MKTWASASSIKRFYEIDRASVREENDAHRPVLTRGTVPDAWRRKEWWLDGGAEGEIKQVCLVYQLRVWPLQAYPGLDWHCNQSTIPCRTPSS